MYTSLSIFIVSIEPMGLCIVRRDLPGRSASPSAVMVVPVPTFDPIVMLRWTVLMSFMACVDCLTRSTAGPLATVGEPELPELAAAMVGLGSTAVSVGGGGAGVAVGGTGVAGGV